MYRRFPEHCHDCGAAVSLRNNTAVMAAEMPSILYIISHHYFSHFGRKIIMIIILLLSLTLYSNSGVGNYDDGEGHYIFTFTLEGHYVLKQSKISKK